MEPTHYKTALIIGAGSGISAAAARAFTASGMKVALAARDARKLDGLAAETGAAVFAVDAADPAGVRSLFDQVDGSIGSPEVVLYNPGARAHGPLADIDPEDVRTAIEICAFGGFLAIQQAARRMVPKGYGAILLTGATASIKGYPLSAAFAMGKFALRGLAQSAARELGPRGVHVAHFIIDGAVSKVGSDPDAAQLSSESIARVFLDVLRQPRDAWTQEIDLRPWAEAF
ncbi:oxidoreductase [Sphingobium amiense]|uniref:Oxidoreductase n=1 Tax=Sphingobium amiense TaxID=135719 RepID=A0A494W8M1_9SPHN|nr:SDR family NAD(P)-dependent oxidoreductase [Sphingobium amiense]BBD96990.1 oxidoreductase [Sphingobium amiense]